MARDRCVRVSVHAHFTRTRRKPYHSTAANSAWKRTDFHLLSTSHVVSFQIRSHARLKSSNNLLVVGGGGVGAKVNIQFDCVLVAKSHDTNYRATTKEKMIVRHNRQTNDTRWWARLVSRLLGYASSFKSVEFGCRFSHFSAFMINNKWEYVVCATLAIHSLPLSTLALVCVRSRYICQPLTTSKWIRF